MHHRRDGWFGRAGLNDSPVEVLRMLMNPAWWSLLLLALLFGALQIWWIGGLLRQRSLARPMREDAFRRSLERIWARQD